MHPLIAIYIERLILFDNAPSARDWSDKSVFFRPEDIAVIEIFLDEGHREFQHGFQIGIGHTGDVMASV